MSERVFIIEDERDLAAIFADYARTAGYTVGLSHDGAEALQRVRTAVPDLIVLDILLPGLDGIAVCGAIRAFSDVPIILVTAKVEEIDRLLGLETGADDYLCKPVSPRELVARIKAILRRRRVPDVPASPLQIDASTRTVRLRAVPLELTATEYTLLAALARRPGVIHSRAQLLDLARSDALDSNDRSIDTHIKNLRRKLAIAAPDLELIHSVYGVGYRLEQ